ncbi:MAG: carboxymuconolactone decarboxylase family protein [Chloroflexota bacterium]|nr:carboxymuconolactone decarboxylase family protein [Chloroflexota bacterium]
MAKSRIRPLTIDEAAPEAREALERFQRGRGAMPNMFRTMALRPEIMRTAADHMQAIFNTGTVDKRLKELLAVRVSQINDCHY